MTDGRSVRAEGPALVIASRIPGDAPASQGSRGLHGQKYGSSSGLPGAADTGRAKGSVVGQQQGPHGQSGPHSQFVIAFTSFLETQVRVGLAGGE